MPWSNQGGGPWGSGGSKGPVGFRTAIVRVRHRRTSRNCCAAARTSSRPCCRAAISAAAASLVLVLGAVVLWRLSGFFRVEPDEVGVVLRFGKQVREVQPGLNYHLPYPVETVLTPKALRVARSTSACASSTMPAAAPRCATCRKKA